MSRVSRRVEGSQEDLERLCARRLVNGNRVTVLPPEGHGEAWSGAAGRQETEDR